MSYLGLDIGTSGCKAVVFNEDGQQLAEASRLYSVRNARPGWAELDSAAVGDACLSTIREAAGKCGSDPVQALAISSQGEAFTVLGSDGKILADAMVSSDARAAKLAKSWPPGFGVERLYEKTGHTAHPIFTLFKLLWLKERRPDLWKDAQHFFCFEDYLHYRLGVEPVIGWSLAGRTMLFNVREKRWDSDILSVVGVDVAQLARPLASGSVVGIIPAAVASELNLARGACVVSGGHDQVCAALGTGALEEGQASLTTGTVECVAVAFEQPAFSATLREANLCTYAHATPDLYATLAYNLTGGNLLRWFRDQWCALEQAEAAKGDIDVYERILRGMAPEPTPLMVLPYFTGSGTPYFDAETPGAILGLRLDTTRGQVLRALLEGLAFELRLNLSLLGKAGICVREIFAVGGGARSRSWLQLKADILNRPILCPRVFEAGCLGAAILACAAVTKERPGRLVTNWAPVREVIEPNPIQASFYADRAEAYAKTYAALRILSPQIVQTTTNVE